MVTRVNPDLSKTEDILAKVLPLALSGERVSFLVDPDGSYHMMARLRTMISRKRGLLRARGVKPQLFNLLSESYPETCQGKRRECLVIWVEKRDSHLWNEALDDLLAGEKV